MAMLTPRPRESFSDRIGSLQCWLVLFFQNLGFLTSLEMADRQKLYGGAASTSVNGEHRD